MAAITVHHHHLMMLFQLLQCLDEDEFARRYRLSFRLNQVHMAMDSYV